MSSTNTQRGRWAVMPKRLRARGLIGEVLRFAVFFGSWTSPFAHDECVSQSMIDLSTG